VAQRRRCGNGEMSQHTGSATAFTISSGVMCDAGWWLAVGLERRGEAEEEALGQGCSDRRRSDNAALSARAHGNVAARRRAAQRVAPGGVKALTSGLQCRIEDVDTLDPAADIFRIKYISETKIAQ
jgi:hypothetical protein